MVQSCHVVMTLSHQSDKYLQTNWCGRFCKTSLLEFELCLCNIIIHCQSHRQVILLLLCIVALAKDTGAKFLCKRKKQKEESWERWGRVLQPPQQWNNSWFLFSVLGKKMVKLTKLLGLGDQDWLKIFQLYNSSLYNNKRYSTKTVFTKYDGVQPQRFFQKHFRVVKTCYSTNGNISALKFKCLLDILHSWRFFLLLLKYKNTLVTQTRLAGYQLTNTVNILIASINLQ